MTQPVWVPLAAVIAIHDRQITRHGGASGMRDRALNLAAYTDARLVDMAAAYAFGISKAHAFVDGNKRTAFVTAITFLRLNGYAFRPEPVAGVRMMEDLAAGQITEADFAIWLSDGMAPI